MMMKRFFLLFTITILSFIQIAEAKKKKKKREKKSKTAVSVQAPTSEDKTPTYTKNIGANISNKAYQTTIKFATRLNMIADFGAKPNDTKSDHAAFIAASKKINELGGNCTLIIPAGEYIVGDIASAAGETLKEDVLHIESCNNVQIVGQGKAILKYPDGQRFGVIDKKTGKKITTSARYFDQENAYILGHCIYLKQCNNVWVQNLELDGNLEKTTIGGQFGDTGHQLPHYGLFVSNSTNTFIEDNFVHHFCLDGITVANKTPNGENTANQNIELRNCRFEYNGRQGFSWISGKGLIANNCTFSHTGRSQLSSAPCAGIDIEPEIGLVRDGIFTNCDFIDNYGCAVLASVGDSKNIQFNNCEIWGTTNWSVWTQMPKYQFKNCLISGSTVWGYDSPNHEDATKFLGCTFSDRLYNGKKSYGNFLVCCNYAKRFTMIDCIFEAHHTKALWMDGVRTWTKDESFVMTNCTINQSHLDEEPGGTYFSVMHCIVKKNVVFNIAGQQSKLSKRFILGNYCTDEGGNSLNFLPEDK
jgi:hypothetical protein